jgi:hypothetical protein
MSGFIVERYWPDVTEVDVRAVAAALHHTVLIGVTYLGCILMPGDEVVMFRFEGPDASWVEAAGAVAGLRCDRVLPAVFIDVVTNAEREGGAKE